MPRRRKADDRQLDLFYAFVGDVPLRDEREGMSLPLVSLSKRKRLKPIEWTSGDGKRWCRVGRLEIANGRKMENAKAAQVQRILAK